jgi:outer membrane biosynthesis protein TonB
MLGRFVLPALCVGILLPALATAQTTDRPALMPAVVDSTLEVAQRLISPHRMRVKAIPVAGPPERALIVFAQSPQPGTVITDSVATIWVSVIATRDLSNLTEREADSIIRYTGLAPGARVRRIDTLEVRRITQPPARVAKERVVAKKPKPKSKPVAQAAATSKPKPPEVSQRVEQPESTPRIVEPPPFAKQAADSSAAVATLRDTALSQPARTASTTLWPWFMVALALGSLGIAALVNKARRDRTLAEELAAHNESSATIHYVIRSDGTPIFRDTHEGKPNQEDRAAD